MNELERLRADLEVLERYNIFGDKDAWMTDAINGVKEQIARLEAEADPWREAKCMIEGWRKDILAGRHVSHAAQNAAHYFDHLTAEVDRLEKRVNELEAGVTRAVVPLQPADRSDELDDVLGDEGPVLDPARVLATAEIALRARKWHETADNVKFIRQGIDLNAKPYRLKWGDS